MPDRELRAGYYVPGNIPFDTIIRENGHIAILGKIHAQYHGNVTLGMIPPPPPAPPRVMLYQRNLQLPSTLHKKSEKRTPTPAPPPPNKQ